ncbi:MAG: amidohydrolase [Gemmatimonadales bacterium]|nr:MAG: amidohydrolase [Gemmatimonadales bacterium]
MRGDMAPEADWIFTDARIWRGGPEGAAPGDADSHGVREGALALREGRVLALGAASQVMAHRGPDTAIFSLGGRFVMPGFVDAHVHLLTGGLRLFRVDLRGASSRQEFHQRVADRTRITPVGEWILGGDWNQEDWGGAFPDRSWLDRATGEHPVFLQRMDLHMGLANSVALELAGISAETSDPENGRIDRDPETGEPTGILRERAMLPIYDAIPDLSDEDCIAAIRTGAIGALALGITQVHDMGAVQKLSESWQSLRVLGTLEAEGRLPLRVNAALPVRHWRRAAELVQAEGYGGGRLRWGGVKAFVDGSFGSSTAWFDEPYLHEPDSRGGPVCDLKRLEADLTGALESGLQPVVHAIGDRANDWLLELCATLERRTPGLTESLRVEHAQHLSEAGLAEFGRTRRFASVQPLHILDDAPWIEMKIGEDRGRRSYAFGSLAAGGARVALGSDWPVAPMDPLGAVRTAMTRILPEGVGAGEGGVWNPGERLDLATALRAHTWGGAVAGGWEAETGSLDPGKFADFIVLSENPFEVDPEALGRDVQVDMTFVDGILAHRRDDSPL